MKLAIRILSIATVILWIAILFFSDTAAYSVLNLGINFEEVQTFPSSNEMTFSLPFSIVNNGYYELADFNLASFMKSQNGTALKITETFVSSIPQISEFNATHTITVDFNQILLMQQASLLLNDSFLNIDILASLNFTQAIPV